MNVVLLDTVGLLALWDASDQWHSASLSCHRIVNGIRSGTSIPIRLMTRGLDPPKDGVRRFFLRKMEAKLRYHKPRLVVADTSTFPLPFAVGAGDAASLPSPWNKGVDR